jgi:hypothetical protein
MPAVPYYLGRPARVWIAAMSVPAPATGTTAPGRHHSSSQPAARSADRTSKDA